MDHVLWVERYRPRKIDDCILPKILRDTFQGFLKAGFIPNLLLSGSAGVGKTTVAKALVDELGSNAMTINGSLKGNIDLLRNDISTFASTVSLMGNGRKYVILDEADYLTNATQPALRNFMEEFSSNCGFILTCNYKNRIIPALQSRCSTVDFSGVRIDPEEKKELIRSALTRIYYILDQEKVEYEKKVVVELFKKYYPDLRKTINELQKYSKLGKIDTGILAFSSNQNLKELFGLLKSRDFTQVRKWVAENNDIDFDVFTSELYKEFAQMLEPNKLPHLILHINEHDYRHGFVTNKEVNTVAMMVNIMSDCF
jgi:DNA polymerase III delta prime subunit